MGLKSGRAKTYFGPTALKRGRAMARVAPPLPTPLAVIPSKSRTSSASNQTLFDNSFAVQGPKLWNAIPHELTVIENLEQFKNKLTKFLLSFPDKPPIRGYTPPNNNSLLSWRNERVFTSLMGGQNY